jgi:two-component system, chemotaxis family, CheB/CheR fusion protein
MSETEERIRVEFEGLLDFIKQNRGFDFTGYKRPTLQRRIEKRIGSVGSDGYGTYREFLAGNPDEFGELFNTILINVTGFFRDPPAWEYVRDAILPRIADARGGGEPIRIWSTGCATGEEAYTVAMLLADTIGDGAFRSRVKIYATDVDEEALDIGRHGRYSAELVEPIPEALRARYLEQVGNSYVFRSDLRRAVIFGRHDLLQDPPISRVDLLLARNTLMYFTADAQDRVLAKFHFSLNDDGYLFLGKSELLLTRSSVFVPVDLRRRVFAPTPTVAFRERLLDIVHGPSGSSEVPGDGRPGKERETAFDSSPIAQLVIDDEGVLRIANHQARLIFGVSPKDLGKPFSDLEMSYRPAELRSRIDESRNESRPVAIREVEMTAANGERRYLDFHVSQLHTPDGRPLGTTISAVDVTRYRSLQDSLERSKSDLETAYEELQATSEELETTNEELQSTNEELETTNEELQSTNEELETLNEELQSTNEELETLNDELQVRTDDLNSVNAFLDAILIGLHSGVAVLDHELRVRAWNVAAEDLWGVRFDEADGKHFLNLDIGLPVNELSKPLRDVLNDGGAPTDLTLAALNRRGKQIELSVRLVPMDLAAERGVIVLMRENGDGGRGA